MDEREPQPEDGPDYHAEHAAWRTRNETSNPYRITEENN